MATLKKLYTEQYIRDIADAIRSKTGTQDTYKVQYMAEAIDDLETGLSEEDFFDNWAETINSVTSLGGTECWRRYPSDGKWLGIVSSVFNFGAYIPSRLVTERGHITSIIFKNDYNAFFGGYISGSLNNNLAIYGRDIFKNIDSTEGTKVGYLEHDTDTAAFLTLYNMPGKFTSFGSNCHPFFTRHWGDGQTMSVFDALADTKPCDFITPGGYENVIAAYMLWDGSNYYICAHTDPGDIPYYNTTSELIFRNVTRHTAYAMRLSGLGIVQTKITGNMYNDTGSHASGYSCSPANLPYYIPFSTFDIKDQDGNILYSANCTFADLGMS